MISINIGLIYLEQQLDHRFIPSLHRLGSIYGNPGFSASLTMMPHFYRLRKPEVKSTKL